MSDREVMRLALDAIEAAHDESLDGNHYGCRRILVTQITALRDALDKQQAEPVAWMYEWQGNRHLTFTDQRFVEQAHPHFNKSTPLFTTAQQAEPVAWPKKREPRAAEITESDSAYARAEGYDEGWNDCLAACMKQQAESVAEPHKRAINADNDQSMSGNPSF